MPLRYYCCLIATALVMSVSHPTWAVVVATSTTNTSAPIDDPGWANVGALGVGAGLYLGDRWVLTANHIGVGSITLDGTEYQAEPGSQVRILNPTGSGLSTYTDLVMYRIETDPGLLSLSIASTAPPIGSLVTMIGRGRTRLTAQTAWNVVEVTSKSWNWTESSPPGDYRGYKTSSDQAMRWGTNLIENNEIINISLPATLPIHVITLVTDFDEFVENEAQAVYGDSGGAMFYKSGNDWQLAGIIDAVNPYPNQPDGTSTAVFSNSTYTANLSQYKAQIEGIMVPEPSSIALLAVGLIVVLGIRRRNGRPV